MHVFDVYEDPDELNKPALVAKVGEELATKRNLFELKTCLRLPAHIVTIEARGEASMSSGIDEGTSPLEFEPLSITDMEDTDEIFSI